MRLVISDEESIPEWLYPGTWSDLETPVEDSLAVDDGFDLDSLWKAIASEEKPEEALLLQGYEDVGIPHDAPSHVYRVHPRLLEALLAVPPHERWKVARRWSGNPNKELLAKAKRLLNTICDFAARAQHSGKLLVLLPDTVE